MVAGKKCVELSLLCLYALYKKNGSLGKWGSGKGRECGERDGGEDGGGRSSAFVTFADDFFGKVSKVQS